jgi:hypothetical protein
MSSNTFYNFFYENLGLATFKLKQSIQPEQMKALMEFTMLDDQITTKHTLPLWNDVKELGNNTTPYGKLYYQQPMDFLSLWCISTTRDLNLIHSLILISSFPSTLFHYITLFHLMSKFAICRDHAEHNKCWERSTMVCPLIKSSNTM